MHQVYRASQFSGHDSVHKFIFFSEFQFSLVHLKVNNIVKKLPIRSVITSGGTS